MAFKNLFTLVLGFCLCTSYACNSDEDIVENPPSDALNKIMPLGASRVEGNRPEFESFRYELWRLLVDGGWDFDYIGTMKDPADYPPYQNLSFDPDHEGRGGWTSDDILNNISDWLAIADDPDIVLFSSPGGNDILDGQTTVSEVVSNINQIIDLLQAENPEVTIVIELLAPGKTDFMTEEFTKAFNEVREETITLATEQTDGNSQVITVDMMNQFNDELLADEVHYNEAGAKFIADRYYSTLETILK